MPGFANQSFNTLTDLKSCVGTLGVQVLLLGLTSMTDNNGGTYTWDDTSVITDNGFTVVQVTGVTTGRWLRVGNSNTLKGTLTFSAITLTSTYVVNYISGGTALPFVPSQVYIQARSVNAAGPTWITAITNTSFTINFVSIPIVGTNNMIFDYLVIKQ